MSRSLRIPISFLDADCLDVVPLYIMYERGVVWLPAHLLSNARTTIVSTTGLAIGKMSVACETIRLNTQAHIAIRWKSSTAWLSNSISHAPLFRYGNHQPGASKAMCVGSGVLSSGNA